MDFTVELTFADSSNGAGRSQFYLLGFFSLFLFKPDFCQKLRPIPDQFGQKRPDLAQRLEIRT